MAATSLHVRSNSLPSRPHPLVSEVEDNISRLRSSQSASSSSSSVSNKLRSLQDLQDCVEKLLALPLNQQALVQDQKFLNQMLDGSLRLLDFCNTTKDALSLMKESVFELQSVLRRRVQGGLHLNDVKQYITCRKTVKKAIQKALKNLKGVECSSIESPEIVSVLRDVEAITRDVFESLASFISQQRRPSGWSLVSKLMHQRKVANEQEEEEKKINEFALVDASTNKYEKVQSDLKDLEMCIEDLEEGTECLYRRMIKTRVTLLNIFN
ncbi:unnamed protein product [Linum tenue]|uniref:Uncharacterized protein n=1 Tax=Linum tenue TaxID=586396 RepID=A0AAV0PDX5_9ROSI|nr:unnamed protein product [Linum tenue]